MHRHKFFNARRMCNVQPVGQDYLLFEFHQTICWCSFRGLDLRWYHHSLQCYIHKMQPKTSKGKVITIVLFRRMSTFLIVRNLRWFFIWRLLTEQCSGNSILPRRECIVLTKIRDELLISTNMNKIEIDMNLFRMTIRLKCKKWIASEHHATNENKCHRRI